MPYICLKQSGKPENRKGLTLLDGATKVYRFLYSNTPFFYKTSFLGKISAILPCICAQGRMRLGYIKTEDSSLFFWLRLLFVSLHP